MSLENSSCGKNRKRKKNSFNYLEAKRCISYILVLGLFMPKRNYFHILTIFFGYIKKKKSEIKTQQYNETVQKKKIQSATTTPINTQLTRVMSIKAI